MAERRKVRPDCIYASNPFHECTEYCIKKTAESKAEKDKKSKAKGNLSLCLHYFLFVPSLALVCFLVNHAAVC